MKKLTYILILLFAITPVRAQLDNFPQSRLDTLIVKCHYRDCAALADSLCQSIVKEKPFGMLDSAGSRQLLLATWYKAKSERAFLDTSFTYSRYAWVLPYLTVGDRCMAILFLQGPDSVMSDTALYKQIPLDKSLPFLTKEGEGFNTCPSLYYLVMNVASRSKRESLPYLEALRAHSRALPDNSDSQLLQLYYDLECMNGKVYNPTLRLSNLLALLKKYRSCGHEYLGEIYYQIASDYHRLDSFDLALRYLDTAISRYSKYEIAERCRNMKNSILRPSISFELEDSYPAQKHSLFQFRSNNMDTVYFRVVEYQKKFWTKAPEGLVWSRVLEADPVVEWIQVVGDSASHRQRRYVGYLPPLEDGTYVLVASNRRDAASGTYRMRTLTTRTAIALTLGQLYEGEGQKGYILNFGTGEVIPNVKVRLRADESMLSRVLGTTTTDVNGYYCISPKSKIDFDDEPDLSLEFYHHGKWHKCVIPTVSKYTEGRDTMYHFLTDRPVYRPGDTLHYWLLAAETQSDFTGHVLAGKRVNLEFSKSKSVLFTLDTVTNEHGVVSGEFVIPQQVLPGYYSFYNNDEYVSGVKIESYKQPTFLVTLEQTVPTHADGCSTAPGLGDTVKVQGLAACYNDVPLGHAQVQYWVTRQKGYGRRMVETVFCSGTTVTDEDGLFDISFVAEPDSMMLAEEPELSQTFSVSVTVTSLSGESQSESYTLNLGKQNARLNIYASKNEIEYSYETREGAPLAGNVTLAIHRLAVPERPYLPCNKNGEYRSENLYGRHTLSREEFHERYPLIAYDSSEWSPDCLPIEATVFSTMLECDGSTRFHHVPIPELPAGMYRVEMNAGDVSEQVSMEVQDPEAKHVLSSDLFWCEDGPIRGYEGDTVTLRVGSRYQGVRVVCAIVCEGGIYEHQLLQLNDNIVTLQIPLTKDLLGASRIMLYAVKEGRSKTSSIYLQVNPHHKELDVRMTSFRDKLVPGQRETFTIQVTETSTQKPLPANLCLTMYDAALDAVEKGRFARLSLESCYRYQLCFDSEKSGNLVFSYWNDEDRNLLSLSPVESALSYQKSGPIEWDVLPILKRKRTGVQPPRTSTARCEDGMVTMAGAVRKRGVATVQNICHMPMSKTMAIAQGDVIPMPADEDIELKKALSDMAAAPRLRTNLSTLAFFEPMLATQSDGSLAYSYTVPDLLTRWILRGWAWTDDMSIGSCCIPTMVTQQRLMIRPTMPRFLRQGDTATLLAEVINMTDSALDATVTCTLDIKSTNQQRTNQQITIHPHSTVPVKFPVQASVGGTVATYKFQVVGGTYSDGEQGPLPILSNRQGVTTSVAMCLHGEGTKTYSMPLPQSATAEPVSLTLEYTGNPMHMAMETLPYYQQQSDPSNLYLFNSYFVNTLGRKIAGQYPELKHSADHVSDQDNPLLRNQSTTQTLMEETPWLAAAQGENERLQRIAQYYDTVRLDESIAQTNKELDKAQHVNGGWSWMPNGKISSVYVTQQILQGLGEMNRLFGTRTSFDESRAIGFLDRAAYDHYLLIQKLLKRNPKLTLDPDDIDYLYTRSFYPSRPFTPAHKRAYQYFYDNLKQHVFDYSSLRSQALLALVFHRQGDTILAQELIYRIKQRASVSDEMGMYWRDNTAGYYYYQRPVEVQAYLIHAFREVTPADTHSVALMQQWLLLQKQTTSWGNNQATLSAIRALLPPEIKHATPVQREPVVIALATDTLRTSDEGSLYLRRTFVGDSLQAFLQHETLPVAVTQHHKGVSWGSLCYQYTEQMDKIPASETGIHITRKLYRVNSDKSLAPITANGKTQLHVGDQVRIVIQVQSPRDYEFVQFKQFRSACMEPTSTASGWASTASGLGYYVAVNNSHDALYIDHLPKGESVIEQNYYFTNPGTFTLAPAVLLCLYAPEFRATSAGSTITVIE